MITVPVGATLPYIANAGSNLERSRQSSRRARNAALAHGAVDLLGSILLDGHLDLQAWSFAEITDAHLSRCIIYNAGHGAGQGSSASEVKEGGTRMSALATTAHLSTILSIGF